MTKRKNFEAVERERERASIYKNLCKISFINHAYNKIKYNKNRTNCSKKLEYIERYILKERNNSPFF